MEQGILTDYLDRKSREVINMLCAKYSYKDDIAVKQEEARKKHKKASGTYTSTVCYFATRICSFSEFLARR